jgi:hypothetical protein
MDKLVIINKIKLHSLSLQLKWAALRCSVTVIPGVRLIRCGWGMR